jgi:hypothetical protein
MTTSLPIHCPFFAIEEKKPRDNDELGGSSFSVTKEKKPIVDDEPPKKNWLVVIFYNPRKTSTR